MKDPSYEPKSNLKLSYLRLVHCSGLRSGAVDSIRWCIENLTLDIEASISLLRRPTIFEISAAVF